LRQLYGDCFIAVPRRDQGQDLLFHGGSPL
jgi:hypothetical protein